MKYKCVRRFQAVSYKGIIVEPAVRAYFYGKVQLAIAAPFSQEKLLLYERKGFLERIVPMQKVGKNWMCSRCETPNQQVYKVFDCARCQKRCVYCRHCIRMGRISSCTVLYSWRYPMKSSRVQHEFRWTSELTLQQQNASQALTKALCNRQDFLLHAVCGAGKTEIFMQAIYAMLQMNWRVAVATPRTDVVLELAPRIQAVFPKTTIHVLYGGATKRYDDARLVVTTTHQLYHYRALFDAIIVDEADAFPYTYDVALQKAVYKAKKRGAPIAIITATPTMQQIAKAKKMNGYFFLARRYHGFDLPVPEKASLYNYRKQIEKGILPKKVHNWILECLKNERPFLLFFSNILLMQQALRLIQQIDPAIESVHAADEARKEKVYALREGRMKGLLTTTILERGITISNIQVAIVGAEHSIFDSRAIIQIAGRAGRDRAFPYGQVLLFHHGESIEMDEAIRLIQQCNKEVL